MNATCGSFRARHCARVVVRIQMSNRASFLSLTPPPLRFACATLTFSAQLLRHQLGVCGAADAEREHDTGNAGAALLVRDYVSCGSNRSRP